MNSAIELTNESFRGCFRLYLTKYSRLTPCICYCIALLIDPTYGGLLYTAQECTIFVPLRPIKWPVGTKIKKTRPWKMLEIEQKRSYCCLNQKMVETSKNKNTRHCSDATALVLQYFKKYTFFDNNIGACHVTKKGALALNGLIETFVYV